jgi:hypothetical protein
MLLVCLVVRLPMLAQAAEKQQQQIDTAVDRGVKFLKQSQQTDGSWNYPVSGATALAGLALLESGHVKSTDPVVRKAAAYLRDDYEEMGTYSLALKIFFFDRLAESRDAPLIKQLGERLVDGQLGGGDWTYNCTPRQQNQAPGSPRRDGAPAARGTLQHIMAGGRAGDNSNTQFGLMGLWVARRHGLDVTAALSKTDEHFRQQQLADGGWSYTGTAGSTDAMTCAGLLGLLVHQGNQAMLKAGSVADLKKDGAGRLSKTVDDPAVKRGLARLESSLTPPLSTTRGRAGLGGGLYRWWSLERVAVAYGLKKIGNVDWYAEGAKSVLTLQLDNGSWNDYAPPVGTSFAILFLKRANLAHDLTGLVTGQQGGDTSLHSGDSEEVLQKLKDQSNSSAGPLKTTDIPDAPPGRLVAALANADARQQAAILQELHDRKGTEATSALAEAIGKLEGDARASARKLLVQRLTRMTANTLGKYLDLEDVELQRAAAEAVAVKQERSLSGKLINLLSSSNDEVANAAHAALVKVTGEQFGRFEGAKPADRFVIVKRWKAWQARATGAEK